MNCDRCDKEVKSRGNRDRNVLVIVDYANGLKRLQHHRLCLDCVERLFKLIDEFYNYKDKVDQIPIPTEHT